MIFSFNFQTKNFVHFLYFLEIFFIFFLLLPAMPTSEAIFRICLFISKRKINWKQKIHEFISHWSWNDNSRQFALTKLGPAIVIHYISEFKKKKLPLKMSWNNILFVSAFRKRDCIAVISYSFMQSTIISLNQFSMW